MSNGFDPSNPAFFSAYGQVVAAQQRIAMLDQQRDLAEQARKAAAAQEIGRASCRERV